MFGARDCYLWRGAMAPAKAGAVSSLRHLACSPTEDQFKFADCSAICHGRRARISQSFRSHSIIDFSSGACPRSLDFSFIVDPFLDPCFRDLFRLAILYGSLSGVASWLTFRLQFHLVGLSADLSPRSCAFKKLLATRDQDHPEFPPKPCGHSFAAESVRSAVRISLQNDRTPPTQIGLRHSLSSP